MRLATGRWVSGEDFHDRERELQILESRVRDGNHTLLTGQRRMGKTSVLRELGRRLEAEGWVFLFADVEAATHPEDAVAELARAIHPIRPIAARVAAEASRWVTTNIEEISAHEFSVKVRAGLDAGTWRRHGERLLGHCAAHDAPVLLVIDELPIFLKRLLRREDGVQHVEGFLSWMRGVLQTLGEASPVVVVSGSIGLTPLVSRLGIADRINHLGPLRLGPWDRETSIGCFVHLAQSYGLTTEDGVASAVYDALGIGIPHHVQSFFARLRDFAVLQGLETVTVDNVEHVYRTALLGPSGQSDLAHYESRLKDALDQASHTMAMEILAEAATQDVFAPGARRCLEQSYSALVEDAPGLVAATLDVLEHDGYLHAGEDGYRFPSRLLKDWWCARFRDHHVPLESRRQPTLSLESRQ